MKSKADLSGEGKVDGGRLQVTLKNGKTESFSYNAVDKTIATPLTNADDTPVTLKELTGDNNDEMERIRSQIVPDLSETGKQNRQNTGFLKKLKKEAVRNGNHFSQLFVVRKE